MISCYTGLPGSGKTYEVVAFIIIPALSKGRRVVTNIHGIDNDAMRAHCADTTKTDIDKIGDIVLVEDDDVKKDGFFPEKDHHIDSIVKPGDMVVLDEANRFYPTDNLKSIPKSHVNFFREHRHFTDPASGFACDIVLITQHISDLHRVFKVVVEFTYLCFKFKALGLPTKYRCDIYTGYRPGPKTKVSGHIRKYDKNIFPLYKSYIGEVSQEDNVDGRLNFWKSPIFMRTMFWIVLFLLGGGYLTYRFLFQNPWIEDAKKDAEKAHARQPTKSQPATKKPNEKEGEEEKSKQDNVLRIVGVLETKDETYYLVNDQARIRYVRGDSTMPPSYHSEISYNGQLLSFWGLSPDSTSIRK